MPTLVKIKEVGGYLNIPCTPVVHQNHTEEVIFCFCDGDRFTHIVGYSHERCDFQFNVKFLARTPLGDLLLGPHICNLSIRSNISQDF